MSEHNKAQTAGTGVNSDIPAVTDTPDEDRTTVAVLLMIDRDISDNPGCLQPMTESMLTELERLVEGVVVDVDYVLPEEITF